MAEVRKALLWAVAATVSAGCATEPPPPLAPAPLEIPAIPVAPPEVHGEVHVAYLSPPPGEPMVDELLASPVLRDPTFDRAVEEWLDYWQDAAASWFPDFVRRMGAFEQTVDSALAARRLPPSLRYLPLIESGYSPSARSHAAAVGLWQLMPGTARELGIEVGPFVDERRNPYRATDAALDFLEELHGRFGSWFLALAAYNGGPNRTRRILRRHAPLAEPSDSVFWSLRRHWPRETRAFVPKLIAAILVAQEPVRYGFPPLPMDPPLRFDEVTVPDATTFDVLAASAQVEENEIRMLNPELYRGFTPPGREVVVRVPSGRGALFRQRYALVSPEERMTSVEHSVSPGETLSHIALRYGVSLDDLREANPDVRPRYIRPGDILVVPLVPVGDGS
ncbi:MAG: transglycosylase SLT domain-containing protein [Longimicrobiales bacterium]|nr:transglycosylase SLT domain-containing protein [Longimicrobiales bacterium]